MSRICGWVENSEGTWATGCGHLFELNDGSPSENSMKFCCFCGCKLEETKYVEVPVDE